MRFGHELLRAAGFLTPAVPRSMEPTPRSMAYFGVVGACLGLAVGASWRTARRVLAPWPAAVVAVAMDTALTGALHLDGLADTADGLLAHVPTKDRLAIMAEPEVGTFGTVALVTTLLGRAAALATTEPSSLAVVSLWACSRSLMALGSRAMPYAREEGLASGFLTDGTPDGVVASGLVGVVGAAVLATVARGRRGLLGVVLGTSAGSLVLLAARRRLGGFTGDVLGAAGVTCETVGLVVMARP